MDFQLDMDFMNAEEAKPVADGIYVLRITNVEVGESKNSGLLQAETQFEIDGHPNAKPIFEYYQAPGQEGLKRPDLTALSLKRLVIAFGLQPQPGMSFAELMMSAVGATAQCKLKIEHDDEYGDKNRVVLPQIK